jgi:hypothetical protein
MHFVRLTPGAKNKVQFLFSFFTPADLISVSFKPIQVKPQKPLGTNSMKKLQLCCVY